MTLQSAGKGIVQARAAQACDDSSLCAGAGPGSRYAVGTDIQELRLGECKALEDPDCPVIKGWVYRMEEVRDTRTAVVALPVHYVCACKQFALLFALECCLS